jgi:hypothetical protein
MKFRTVSSLFLFVSAASVLAAEEKPGKIDLGGLRQVRATITLAEEEYVVRVRFLPIRCFDKVTNTTLNQENGRFYALQSLAKHLSDKDNVELTVSGARVEATAIDGKFQTLVLRVPRLGLEVAQVGGKGNTTLTKPERVVFSSTFFTRKRDYLHTLDDLAKQIEIDLDALPKEGGSFELAVAKVEDKALSNLDALEDEISRDKLLLTIEKDELLDAIRQREHTAVNRLKEIVKRHEVKALKEKP